MGGGSSKSSFIPMERGSGKKHIEGSGVIVQGNVNAGHTF